MGDKRIAPSWRETILRLSTYVCDPNDGVSVARERDTPVVFQVFVGGVVEGGFCDP